MVYRFLRWLLRLATRVFFRQIEVVGTENIPPDGAVLFAGNHPNSLIDPILIIATCGRLVRFAAKDALFKTRIMRAILGGLGAVPIARRHDVDGPGAAAAAAASDPRNVVDNDSAFAAMYAALGHGDAIGIFPEGISHDESQLAKLKTGAARLALGALGKTGKPVTIVPCGLTFIHPKRFRSRVLVQYGTPIIIDDAWRAAHAVDDREQVRALTAEIEAAMRRLTVNAPDWDTLRALDAVRRLYQPQEISIEERVELARRFNTHYLQAMDDPRVVGIMRKVDGYQQKLDELGLTDRELARDLSKLEIIGRMVRHLTLMVIGLPLTVPGAPLHLPALALSRLMGGTLTPRKDVIATTKLVIGMLAVVLAYAVAVALLAWKVSTTWAFVAAVLFPVSGWATLRVLDRYRLVRRGLGALVRQLRFRREVRALREERAALVAEVIRVVGEVMPKDLPALFPADHPLRAGDSIREHADLDAELDKDAAEEPR